MDWLSPFVIVTLVAVVALSIFFGRLRRDRPSVIALNTVGFVLFLIGLRMAANVDAFNAVAVATLGAVLFTMGSERSRAERRVERGAEVSAG